MPAVQKKMEFVMWSKEEESLEGMGLVRNSALKNVAKICPSCVLYSSQLHFTNPLAYKFIGKGLEGAFEHVLIVEIEW